MIQSPRLSAIVVTLSYDKNSAVVLLPSLKHTKIADSKLRAWLAKFSLRLSSRPRDPLECVLDALSLPHPESGWAALRMWGQTGDRPTDWIAAADPVYLEPRLDHLRLHALLDAPPSSRELRGLFDHLQALLADNVEFGFVRIGNHGYVRAMVPIATAHAAAILIDQQSPIDFMPRGAGSSTYRTLLSEVEMALHDHEVNRQRMTNGLPPINSLWLWGGGFAPQQRTEPRPPLFAGDPLLKGCWQSAAGVVAPWPGSIDACLDASLSGFVAMPSDIDRHSAALETCLQQLREAAKTGRLSRITLIFSNGDSAHLRRADNWRFWRRSTAMFES